MKKRSLAVALLIAQAGLAPVTFTAPAWGQAPADDATTSMARARFKEGVEFYDKGAYEQARASFLQAYALKKHPAVLLNLAWSCVKSGHALEAEKYFKQFLAEGKDITDKQRADANDGLTQSRAKLGRIEVVATAGTEVTVDGEKVGTAPLPEPISVEAGAHTVKLKGADGATDTESVTVMGGEKATTHFAKAAIPVVTPPPPPPPEAPAPPPPPPPPEAEKKPVEAPSKKEAVAEKAPGKSLFAAPSNLLPAVALGAVAVAGYVVGGVMVAFKNKAQSQANSTASEIIAHGGGSGTCSAQSLAREGQFAQACSAYQTDNNQVNQDATAANVAVGVGAAATVGFVVYWLLAEKGGSEASARTAPVVMPVVGRSEAGLSLSARF
jgi:tetratricopeptide (TPR) repeat protein